jgi:hypothetical protein
MGIRQAASFSSDIDETRRRVEEWRSGRAKWEPMPAELWEAATGLAGVHGVYAVARGVGVDYAALRRRVEERWRGEKGRRGAAASGFVELDAAELFGAKEAAGTVIELVGGDGSRLTVRLGTGSRLDVAGLVGAFLGGRS